MKVMDLKSSSNSVLYDKAVRGRLLSALIVGIPASLPVGESELEIICQKS
jgi:hypothetical protein